MKAMLNGIVLAESDKAIELEGSLYFPPDSVDRKHLRASATQTVCPWKGKASYYDVIVEGESVKDGAWSYHTPNEAAAKLRDHVAFWKDVTLTE